MSDFEDRLGRALGEGAEDAPGAVGLTGAARTRARRRRQRRASIGVAVAVLVAAVPIAVVVSGGGQGDRGTDAPSAGENAAIADQRVTCGEGDGWTVATMDGGLTGVVDDDEVRAAFAEVLVEAPTDAPTAILEDGAEEAPYIVLAADGDSYTLGIGPWSIAGPGRTAMSAGLERQPDGSLRMTGWGDCQLTSALPAGRSLVEVSAPDGGVDPTTDEPVVMVSELQCASARDPEPFLGEPTILADDEQVLVTMTSDPVVGDATCPGNPIVPLTLSLDEPIGDRELLDAGTFPPTPIEVAPSTEGSNGGWHTVTYEGDPVNESGDNRVVVDLPPGWERLDTSGCEFAFPRFGPPGNDPCEESSTLTFFGSATYDSCCLPGLEGTDDTAGDGYVGSLVGYVDAPDHQTARRVIASLRLPGDPAPSATWRTDGTGVQGTSVELPDDGSVDVAAQLVRTGELSPRTNARQTRSGRWVAQVDISVGTRVLVTAPTQALADLVASMVPIAD